MSQINLSICHLNVQSLLAGVDTSKYIPAQVSKLDEIYTTLKSDHAFDVIAHSETWLQENHLNDCILLENNSCFLRGRNNGCGGGPLFHVHNEIPCIQRDDLTHDSVSEPDCIILTAVFLVCLNHINVSVQHMQAI